MCNKLVRCYCRRRLSRLANCSLYWATDHKEARCIFPNAHLDRSCSTRVQWNQHPGCDSSCGRLTEIHQHTSYRYCNYVNGETGLTMPGTFYRSLSQLRDQRNSVLMRLDCSLQYIVTSLQSRALYNCRVSYSIYDTLSVVEYSDVSIQKWSYHVLQCTNMISPIRIKWSNDLLS